MAEFETPLSRSEAILTSIINGTEYTDPPLSRLEALLLELKNGGGGGGGSETVVNVTGSDPEIEAVVNTRYICGVVSTIEFTPCASGSCEVIFESGSTAAVLTLPNAVLMPEWFDPTELETNRIYDIIITDGIYGSCISYPTT